MTTFDAETINRKVDFSTMGKTIRPTEQRRDDYPHARAVEVVGRDGQVRSLAAHHRGSRDEHGRDMFGWGYSGTGVYQLAEAVLKEAGLDDTEMRPFVGQLRDALAHPSIKSGEWSLDLEELGNQIIAANTVAFRRLDDSGRFEGGVDLQSARADIQKSFVLPRAAITVGPAQNRSSGVDLG